MARRPLSQIMSSPMFLLAEDTGLKIYPLAVLDIKLGAHRVEQGYSEDARVFVFPCISPFLIVCMDRNGQHYHIPVSGPDPDTVGSTVHSMVESDDYAEDFMEHFIEQEIHHKTGRELQQRFGVVHKPPSANDNPPLGKTIH